MSAGWHGAAPAQPIPAQDFASEILWRMSLPVAVLDHSGHLEFANQASLEGHLAGAVFDSRGFLVDPEIDALRQEVLRHARQSELAVRAIHSNRAGVLAEVFELAQVPGWTAVVFHPPAPSPGPDSELPSAALMLHELRSPVLGVTESLDRLTQDSARAAPELSAAVSRQSRAVARLTSVLAGLTDLVRAGELTPERYRHSRVSLGEVARDVHETFELLAGATGHELLVAVDAGVPPIRGDRALLTRAVANLVDNALKYSPPPGPVRLVVAGRGSLAVVEVWDSGAGVAPADRQRIFEPFVRLEESLASSSTGSGLGLAVVHSVVRAHGGSLSVEYEPGVGNVFRLSFLISATPEESGGSRGSTALNSWSGPHGSIG